MQALADPAAIATADWTGVLAIGTFALVVVTVGATIYQNLRENRLRQEERKNANEQLENERKQADQRLKDERLIAEDRIRDEREFAARERVRDRQAVRAGVLLGRVANLRLNLRLLWSFQGPTPESFAKWDAALDALLANLKEGAHVDAPLLGHKVVAERYTNLVRLMLAQGSVEAPAENISDLRNYAKFVKLSLIALVDGADIPSLESESVPRVHRIPGDGELWHPNPIPPGWDSEDYLDPDDPRYQDLP
jgi:hypothetical protein